MYHGNVQHNCDVKNILEENVTLSVGFANSMKEQYDRQSFVQLWL